MKRTQYIAFLMLALMTNATLHPMKALQYNEELEDFTTIEVTDEPAKKAALDAEEARKLIVKAEKKLTAIKDVAESKEIKNMISTTEKIIAALRKIAFKNGPGFEIANKTDEPIWVTVVSNGKIKTNQRAAGCDKIEPSERFALELRNLKENMLIGIYQENPKAVSLTENGEFSTTPDFTYETTEGAQGKTKYLTWNPSKHNTASKYLYPQTGRLAGWAEGSSSGYSLSDNLKPFQLRLREIEE